MIVAPSEEATLVLLQKAHSAAMLPLVATAESTVVASATGAAEEKKAADKP